MIHPHKTYLGVSEGIPMVIPTPEPVPMPPSPVPMPDVKIQRRFYPGCFRVDHNGFVQIQDMLLNVFQGQLNMFQGLRQKYDDCDKRGKNMVVLGSCFIVDKNGFVRILNKWVRPKRLPDDFRKAFYDCSRSGDNKEIEGRDFWPKSVWKEGGDRNSQLDNKE